MTITFEYENDIIVYALEKIISYARDNQYIFLAQSVWWISSILGLQEGLIIHIDNQRKREPVQKLSAREISSTPSNLTEDQRHERIIGNEEEFIQESSRSRTALQGGRGNTLPLTKRQIKKAKRKAKIPIKTFETQTEGIAGSELRRRKAAGECQRCAWPPDRKGSYKTIDCYRLKKSEKGTALFPKEI